MSIGRVVLAAVAATLGLFAWITPAFAHTELQSSSPAQGESLSAPPNEVKLTFGEAVTVKDSPITVTGPDGASWTVGQVTLAGAVVSAPVTPTGPAGPYVLTYRVYADDGDEVTGTIPFTMTVPVSAPPSAAATPSAPTADPAAQPSVAPAAAPLTSTTGSGAPGAVTWLVIAMVIIAAVGTIVLGHRRRRP